MIEPVLPMEAEQLPLMEAAADLRTEVAALVTGHPGLRRASGWHTVAGDEFVLLQQELKGSTHYPADLELALQQAILCGSGCAPPVRNWRLRICSGGDAGAGSACDGVGGHFSRAWVQRIDRELYQRLDEESRVIVDAQARPRAIMLPASFAPGM